MSRENVQVVAEAIQALERRDKDRFFAFLHPAVEWHLVGFIFDQEQHRRGREEVWDYLTFLDDEFDDIRIELGEYIDVHANVVVPIRVRMKGKGSGVPTGFAFTTVFTLADGQLVRARNYATTAEALDAVQLRD